MSRIPLPLAVDDITAFARCLRTRLTASQAAPSHLELLNWLAKAAGYKNFQHFRASVHPNLPVAATEPVVEPEPTPEPLSETRLKRLARLYDAAGRLTRWPSKRGMQLTCLWTVWAAIPSREVFDEPGVTRILAGTHLFGDPVLLRRELCDLGLLWRTPDCRAYRRVERRPPPEALELLRRVRAKAQGQ
ncbi:DUF2087 domain-containing protein [Solidesulfovibrio alcoholivorans]|uniref:DUF2087 domain-containing protein n=1 Tax=Solidesulfovibrio alcoholivorans TaxID=81406 RepID=UPI0004955997|nr:DUF2087 domain-containing protein [Solidesulfovibrio alcoholivorans]